MQILYRFFLFIFFIPSYVLADAISLEELNFYINSFKTLEADFEQINNDNSISRGILLIKKPGKLRMKYEEPNNSIILVNQGFVTIFDLLANTLPQRFLLEKTPFRVLLLSDLNLEMIDMDIDLFSDGEKTKLRIKDLSIPNTGYIEMVFNTEPITLEEWLLVNALGEKTVVNLTNVLFGGDLENSLFDPILELEKIENNR